MGAATACLSATTSRPDRGGDMGDPCGARREIVRTVTMNGDWFIRRHGDAVSFRAGGVLPPPLWGRVGEGGRCCRTSCVRQLLPPPLTPPHKGEGNTPSLLKRMRPILRVVVTAAASPLVFPAFAPHAHAAILM